MDGCGAASTVGPFASTGARGKEGVDMARRSCRKGSYIRYASLRILDQPWDDDDSRSGGWQANKSWLTVWEPLPICPSLLVWGMPSVKPLLLPWADRRVTTYVVVRAYNSFSPLLPLSFHPRASGNPGEPPSSSPRSSTGCILLGPPPVRVDTRKTHTGRHGLDDGQALCALCVGVRVPLWIHHTLLQRGATMYLGIISNGAAGSSAFFGNHFFSDPLSQQQPCHSTVSAILYEEEDLLLRP